MIATPAGVTAYIHARLDRFKRSGDHWRGPCPIHGGRRDSFAINASTGLYCCHSECDRGGDLVDLEMQLTGADFREASKAIEMLTGVPATAKPPAATRPKRSRCDKPRIVATYDYISEDGEVLYQVVRLEPKSFRQRRPNSRGGWSWKLGDVRKVLYHLPEVLENSIIFLVEGEKDVEALREYGFIATTAAGGASAPWFDSYTEALANREVILIPDNDEPGWKRGRATADRLIDHAARVRLLELPDGIKDAAEYFEKGGSELGLLALLGER